MYFCSTAKYAKNAWLTFLILVVLVPCQAQENIPQVIVTGNLLPKGDFTMPPSSGNVPWTFSPEPVRRNIVGAETTPVSKTNSPSDDCKGNPKGKLPVIYATGEKFQDEEDFKDASLAGLSLTRRYRSTTTGASSNQIFGPHWFASLQFPNVIASASCQVHLDATWMGCVPDWIQTVMPDGATHMYYIKSWNGLYPSGSDGTGVLGYIDAKEVYWELRASAMTVRYDPRTKNVLSFWGAEGKQFEYGYTNGKLTSITTSFGKNVKFVWDGDRVSQIIDPDGKTWNYGYDAARNLVSVTPPSGAVGARTYHYESPVDPTLLTGITIDGVRKTRYVYDSNKRVVHSGYENGEAYDDLSYGSNYTVVNNENGQPVQYNFEQSGSFKRLVSTNRAGTSSCGASNSLQGYDAYGNLSYTLDWNGNRTEYSYNADGQKLEERFAVGTPQATKRVYIWSGSQLQKVTDYDVSNQATFQTSWSYISSNSQRIATQILTDLITGKVQRTEYSYTNYSNGTLASRTESLQLPGTVANTTYIYDTFGNLTSVTNAVGHKIQYSNFNGFGQARTIVDVNNVVTNVEYDPRGNILLTAKALPDGTRTIRYAYDGNGNVTAIQDANSRITRFGYNSAGRLISRTNPLGETEAYALDVIGRTTSTHSSRKIPSFDGFTIVGTDNSEFVKSVTYDSLGRVGATVSSDNRRWRYGYDGNGNVKQIRDPAERVTGYDYDVKNRLVKITRADGGIFQMDYDGDGNLKTVTDPRGLRTTYTYDGFGNRTGISSPDTGTSTYSYDLMGNVISVTLANGKTISYQWDGIGRMIGRKGAGGETNSYTYDEGAYGRGHLTRMDDQTGRTTYQFDAAGALVEQTNDIYGKTFHSSWRYDSAGKLVSMTDPNGLILNYSYDDIGHINAIKSGTPLKTSP